MNFSILFWTEKFCSRDEWWLRGVYQAFWCDFPGSRDGAECFFFLSWFWDELVDDLWEILCWRWLFQQKEHKESVFPLSGKNIVKPLSFRGFRGLWGRIITWGSPQSEQIPLWGCSTSNVAPNCSTSSKWLRFGGDLGIETFSFGQAGLAEPLDSYISSQWCAEKMGKCH